MNNASTDKANPQGASVSKILRSSRIVTPNGIVDGAIEIQCEKISGIFDSSDAHFASFDRDSIIDYGDFYLLPGVIDGHVHVNQPGRTEWEGGKTATAAAAAGGITTLVDMPLNSSPVTVDVLSLQKKQSSYEQAPFVDMGFHGGAIGTLRGTNPLSQSEIAMQVRALVDAGVLGVKVFLCDSGLDEFPAITERELRAVMPVLADRGVPLWVHAELVPLNWESPKSIHQYREWSSARSKGIELTAIEWMIKLCRETGCAVHIVHLANAEALSRIHHAKNEGLPITIETCPHYLYFCDEHIPDDDPRYKCCPPIRDLSNRELLWQGLELGEIDTLGSDHSPCPPEMKFLDTKNFASAWGGISSLQLMLPVVWHSAMLRDFSVTRLTECMSSSPAKLLGLSRSKGRIAPGMDADIVAFNPDVQWIVKGDELYHRHKVTPYEGFELRGKVFETWLRGKSVYRDGSLTEIPFGNFLRRSGNLDDE
jgi:allantoinase